MNPSKPAAATPAADTATDNPSVRDCVAESLRRYFEHLEGQPASDVYAMVLAEVEAPLFTTVMQHTQGNQSEAAQLLGINRNTLRKKLKLYGLL